MNAVALSGAATGIQFPANVSGAGSARLGPFQTPIPPMATAEQLAASIALLLSDEATNNNGAVLTSDSGWAVQ